MGTYNQFHPSTYHRSVCTNKRQRKPKGQSKIDIPQKLATLGTQDTGRRQTKLRGNEEWTIQRNWQHWVHKTHDEDKQI